MQLYISKKQLTIIALTVLTVILVIPINDFLQKTRAEKQEKQVCRNFRTQPEAQSKYDQFSKMKHFEKLVSDLDRDKDGIACESLPLK